MKVNVPSYRDNSDGTVTDLNTGLIWSKAVDKNTSKLGRSKENCTKDDAWWIFRLANTQHKRGSTPNRVGELTANLRLCVLLIKR